MLKDVARLARFSLLRLAALWAVLWISVFLIILLVNWGGAVDAMRIAQIRHDVNAEVAGDPAFELLTPSERRALIENLVALEMRRQRLDQPFIVRSGAYMINAMTLNLGRAEILMSDHGSRMVRDILLERLPHTLVLFATADFLLFFFSLFFGLFLSRRYGGFWDRLIIALAPSSAAPAWFFGIFLILIFAAILGWLPWGGMVEPPPPAETLAYALSVLRHMVLPVSAIIIAAVFIVIYYWRTFFLVYSSEDYVELAKAKGLSSRAIERRYVLRPTLPPILTSFLLSVILVWMGGMLLEVMFNWPGLGRLMFEALGQRDTPVILGLLVIYGYLLAVTVFILDFAYAALDPRVRVGGGATRR